MVCYKCGNALMNGAAISVGQGGVLACASCVCDALLAKTIAPGTAMAMTEVAAEQLVNAAITPQAGSRYAKKCKVNACRKGIKEQFTYCYDHRPPICGNCVSGNKVGYSTERNEWFPTCYECAMAMPQGGAAQANGATADDQRQAAAQSNGAAQGVAVPQGNGVAAQAAERQSVAVPQAAQADPLGDPLAPSGGVATQQSSGAAMPQGGGADPLGGAAQAAPDVLNSASFIAAQAAPQVDPPDGGASGGAEYSNAHSVNDATERADAERAAAGV